MDIRDAFFGELMRLMHADDRILLLSVDMGSAVVAKEISKLGTRYLNVGVSEANAVTVGAALSARGFRPFIYGISAFLLNRARAQLRHDVSIGGRCVHLIGSGPGLTYAEDGPSHHCLDDLSLMRSLPFFRTFSPWDAASAAEAARRAAESRLPTYVRLDKGTGLTPKNPFEPLTASLYLRRIGSKTLTVSTATALKDKAGKWEDTDSDILLVFELNNQTVGELAPVLAGYEVVLVDDESFGSSGLYSIACEAAAQVSGGPALCDRSLLQPFIQEKYPREELRCRYRNGGIGK